MAFTQEHLDAIDRALAGSELEVSYGDRKVRYRSVSELKEQRSLVLRSLMSDSTGKPRPRSFTAIVDRGL